VVGVRRPHGRHGAPFTVTTSNTAWPPRRARCWKRSDIFFTGNSKKKESNYSAVEGQSSYWLGWPCCITFASLKSMGSNHSGIRAQPNTGLPPSTHRPAILWSMLSLETAREPDGQVPTILMVWSQPSSVYQGNARLRDRSITRCIARWRKTTRRIGWYQPRAREGNELIKSSDN
jgi:hypothetical protein